MTDKTPVPPPHQHSLKLMDAMPKPDNFIKNKPIAPGQHALEWLGQLQGQINHRVQAYHGTPDVILDPKLVFIYEEEKTSKSVRSGDPRTLLWLKAQLPEGFDGMYRLELQLALSISNKRSVGSIEILKNNERLLGFEDTVGFEASDTVKWEMRQFMVPIGEGSTEFSVRVGCTKPMMSDALISMLYGGLYLTRLG